MVLVDSPVICEYLDSLHPRKKLFAPVGSASTIVLIEHAFNWSLATVSTAIAGNLVRFGMAGPKVTNQAI